MIKKILVGLLAVSLVANAIMICKIKDNNTQEGEGTNNHKQYVVSKGETLWDIAKEYGEGKDVRKTVFEIKELNALKDSRIFEDQVLKIPTK